MQENKAVWLQGPGVPSIVGPAPVPEPSEKELLIQVKAIAVQPGEWKIQAGIIPIPLTYPAVIGVSLSGVVVKTGSGVDRFQPGDRVACNSTGTLRNDPRYGAYQRYCLAPQALTSKIYDTDFDEAASLATAYGAFSAWFIHLGLDPSGLWSREAAKKCDESVLVWGVSSSFGSAAAQIARRAGYNVVGVASAHHESLRSKVGVSHFADRKADDVVDTVAALGPFEAILAAADSAEDQVKMGDIAARLGGGHILSTMGLRSGVTLSPGVTISFQQFLDDYLDPKNEEFTESVWWGYLEDAFAQGWLHSLPLKAAGGLSQVAGAWKSLQSGEVSGTRLIIDPELD